MNNNMEELSPLDQMKKWNIYFDAIGEYYHEMADIQERLALLAESPKKSLKNWGIVACVMAGINFALMILSYSLGLTSTGTKAMVSAFVFGCTGASLLGSFANKKKLYAEEAESLYEKLATLQERIRNHYERREDCPIPYEMIDRFNRGQITRLIETGRASTIEEAVRIRGNQF